MFWLANPGNYPNRRGAGTARETVVSLFYSARVVPQPPEVFAQVLDRAWKEANPIETLAPGDVCDGDACEL